MRQDLTKVVKLDGQSSYWNNDCKDYTVVAFNLKRDADDKIGTISFEKLTGPDPYYRSIMDLFVYDSDLLNCVKEYVVNFKRTSKFIVDVREGQSGCREARLFTKMTILPAMSKDYENARLRISCNDKISPISINEIWIGDLVELFLKLEPDFINDLKFYLVNCNRGLQRYNRKDHMKYVKPIIPDRKISLDDILDSEEILENPEFKLFAGNGTKYLYNDGVLKEQYHLEKMSHLYDIINKDESKEDYITIGSKYYETKKGRLIKVSWDKDKIKRAKKISLEENTFVEYDPKRCLQIKFNENTIDINLYIIDNYYPEMVTILSVWQLDKDGNLTREDLRDDSTLIHRYDRNDYQRLLYQELKEHTNLAD